MNKHQGDAADTWLAGGEDSPSAVPGKKTTPRGETSQLRQAPSTACASDKLPLSGHLYPLALLHLHLHKGPSCSLSGVPGTSLENCVSMLEGEVLVNRGYNVSTRPNCPPNNCIYLMLA